MTKEFNAAKHRPPESFPPQFGAFVREGQSDILPVAQFLSARRLGIRSFRRRWEFYLQILRHTKAHPLHMRVIARNWHWEWFDKTHFQITSSDNTDAQRWAIVQRVYKIELDMGDSRFWWKLLSQYGIDPKELLKKT